VYALHGDAGRVRIAAPRPPAFADGLWRTTCFEAFLGRPDAAEYCEFNFAPSGQGAA
jgi:hypothetical protein